jgi:mono/diheme cytochrome c family protein
MRRQWAAKLVNFSAAHFRATRLLPALFLFALILLVVVANIFSPPPTARVIPHPGVRPVAGSNAPPVFAPEFTAEDRALLTRGQTVYKQLCFACHGLDGKGLPLTSGPPGATMAPSLKDGPIATGWRDAAINVLLKGLNGPVDGRTYTAVMAPEQFNSDLWIASVLSYVRTGFGNGASLVSTNDVAATRAAFTNRETPWTIPELLATLPPPLANRAQWKLTASRNSAAAPLAVDTNAISRYRTRAAQAPSQWFQIQLPQPETIAGLEWNTGAARDEFPRGYRVQLSQDGRGWEPPVAEGRGTGAQTEIVFPSARAKYLRITLTASAPAHNWSIHDLQLLAPAPPPPPRPTSPPPRPEPSKYD